MKSTVTQQIQLNPRSQSEICGTHVYGELLVLAFARLLACPAALNAQQNKPWEKIPIPKLHEFKPQQPKRIELKNGIVLFLQEDHELPFVSGSVHDSRRLAR